MATSRQKSLHCPRRPASPGETRPSAKPLTTRLHGFFDTNLFLYAASQASEEHAKHAIAKELILETDYLISTQVLQEFIAAGLRRKHLGIDEAILKETVELLATGPAIQVSPEMICHALGFRRRYQISYWDAAILAASVEAGCTTLFTEDLNHGQLYEGVAAFNPFRANV